MQKNLVLVSQYHLPDKCGSCNRTTMLAEELSKFHKVTVVTTIPHYPDGAKGGNIKNFYSVEQVNPNYCIYRIWIPKIPHSTLVTRLFLYLYFTIMATLFLLVKIRKVDLLWGLSPNVFNAFPVSIYGKLFNKPVITNIDDLWPDAPIELGITESKPLIKLIKMISHMSYNIVDGISTISGTISDITKKRSKLDDECIQTIEVGFPKKRLMKLKNSINNQRSYDNNDITFLYFGTLSPSYDFDILIRAFRNLDAKLVIQGRGPRYDELLKKTKNAKNIFLSNEFITDESLDNLLISADFLVLPMKNNFISRTALPTKLFEYMSAGKPIILVGRGEPMRLLSEAEIYIPIVDLEEDISNIIQEMKNGGFSKYTLLGNRGQKYIENHLSSEIIGIKANNFVNKFIKTE